MASKNILTHAHLREVLDYNPKTGKFRWLVRKSGRKLRVLDNAGYLRPDGYRMIGINRTYHYAHRLAWLFMTGRAPRFLIDHINQNPSDNRWSNLRRSTHKHNSLNSKMNALNSSGFKGVYWHKVKAKNGKDISRWCAMLGRKYLGHFNTREEADQAYKTELAKQFTKTAGSRRKVK